MSDGIDAHGSLRKQWLAKEEAKDKARRTKFGRIVQHSEVRLLGNEQFEYVERKRFDCMAVVADSTWAAVCVRSMFGDAVVSRMLTGEWCYSVSSILEKHNGCGPWRSRDHVWLSKETWGPKADWKQAADVLRDDELEDDDGPVLEPPGQVYQLARETPVHMVGLDVIERSFDMPIERIAISARRGRWGQVQSLYYIDRLDRTAQSGELSNLEAFALAICVYAQAGGE